MSTELAVPQEISRVDDPVLRLQNVMLRMPQVELETFHHFADGMYARVVPRPAGTTIVGKVHKREHFYIIAKGSVKVWSGGDAKVYAAGDIVVSKPGTKRAVFAIEDSICITVHRNKTRGRNLDKIEKALVEPDERALFDSANKVRRLK